MSHNNEEDMDVIMVIGSAGLGKSTLIKSFCTNESIKTSGSALSCTHDAEIYREYKESKDNEDEKKDNYNNQSRMWVDTIGAEDTSAKLKDEDVLRNVMQMLSRHIESKKQKINLKIKVIWVVKQDVRGTSTLQRQAKFISSFAQNNKDAVWNSTIIVVKEGKMSPGKHVQGALHAAFQNGAPFNGLTDNDKNKLANIKNIGFSRIDLMEFDDEDDKEFYTDMAPKKRMKKGFLYENEAKNEICLLLKQIKYLPININKQKCTKCGIIGDKRFVNLLCHPESEFIHSEKPKRVHTKDPINVHQIDGIELYHDQGITNYHDGSEKEAKVGGAFHDGSPEYYHDQDITTKKLGDPYHNGVLDEEKTGETEHPGKFKASQDTKKVHSGTIEEIHDSWYHDGNVSLKKYGHFCPKCSDDLVLRRVKTGSFKCVLCKDDITEGSSMYKCPALCNANNFDFTSTDTDYAGNKTTINVASGTFVCKSCSKQETKIVYSCCGGLANRQGCVAKYKKAYSCCNRPEFSVGCEEEQLKSAYTCCGEDEESNGCQDVVIEKYKCCGGKKTSIGCYTPGEDRYQCCGGPSEHPGCKIKYTCCKKGAGSKGCKFGKSKIWSCCDSNIKATGCKLKYPCCNKSSSFDGCKQRTICCKKDKGSVGCKQVYGCCEQALNKKGCTFKFACCGKTMEDDDDKGCYQQCMNCKKSWGNTEGCLQEDVEHNMIDY